MEIPQLLRVWVTSNRSKQEYARIQELTRQLRSSDDPYWVQLRRLLDERGVAIDSLMILSAEPNAGGDSFCIAVHDTWVIPKIRVYTFDYNYDAAGTSTMTDQWEIIY
jgi:hypothetical protein